MKKLLFPLLVIALFLTSCDKIEDFEKSYSTNVQITASEASIMSDTISSPDVLTKIDSILAAHAINSTKITKISLQKMELELSSPLTGDLTFLKSISVYISANGMDDVKIAEVSDVPNCVSHTLVIDPIDTCIKYFILKERFHIKLVFTTDKNTTETHVIHTHMNMLFH